VSRENLRILLLQIVLAIAAFGIGFLIGVVSGVRL